MYKYLRIEKHIKNYGLGPQDVLFFRQKMTPLVKWEMRDGQGAFLDDFTSSFKDVSIGL